MLTDEQIERIASAVADKLWARYQAESTAIAEMHAKLLWDAPVKSYEDYRREFIERFRNPHRSTTWGEVFNADK